MTTRLFRSLTACSFSTLIAIASAGATDFGVYGSAPASLDFPSGNLGSSESDLRKAATIDVKKNSWLREEHSLLSAFDPFPVRNVAPIDPLSKKRVDRVFVGPAYKTRAYGSDYDFYRYVTFFNVTTRKERMYGIPIARSECFDKEAPFAKGTHEITFSAKITAGVEIEGIGISTEFSQDRKFGIERDYPSDNEVADFTTYAIKQDWEGRTFRELYNSKTGKDVYLTKETSDSPFWVYILFPLATTEKYPLDFSVRDADWTLDVEKTVLKKCGSETRFGVK